MSLKPAAALLSALLCAVSVRAAEPSPCACAASRRCWAPVMAAYRRRVAASQEAVRRAAPNRFFPISRAFALRWVTDDGHFLSVECGSARVPCTDKREELERRLIVSGLLGALSLGLPEGTLYDPVTWRVSERGEKTFAELKTCRPGLAGELAAIVLGAD
ncbi:MAG: hypothetical protein KGJ84_08865 [Elusimicrobia bacterium]|nr:hypothetical protein [Elusimicrobiota bacterium]